MGFKAQIVLGSFLAVLVTATAQQENYIQPGLLSSSMTLAPAQMLNRSENNFYVVGFLEGKLDKHLSLRGETHYMLPNATDKFLKANVRTFFGIQYGVPIGNFEWHIGFQPGMSFMQTNRDMTETFEVVPSLMLNTGVRFYVWKYFHFFANASYIHAEMHQLNQFNGMADELLLSAGLGLNLQVVKSRR